MGSDNRRARLALASIFGSGCMFKKSHAEEYIEKLGTIKTYKRFKEEKHYTGKKTKCLESIMTLHHLKHKSEGGKATIQNGAIINELAHRYLHSLPRTQEEIINDYIREWKRQNYDRCNIELVEEIEEPYEAEMAEMEVTPERITFKKLSKKEKKREQRAKKKAKEKERKKEQKRWQRLKKELEDR